MQNLGLTDKPIDSISQESLGISDYVYALSNFIISCQTPMTIAIQADWGVGKTSMMNLVKENIDSTSIKTIWFNTWQFSQFNMSDDLSISLLNQFVKRIGGEDSKEIIKKLSFLTKKAGVLFAKAALGNAAGAVISGGEKILDSMFEEDLDSSEQIVKLKNQLEDMVKKRIEKEKLNRIVIFIDDLDRLEPKKAVELLEIMKLFLDIPQCVFVLAVDYGVVITGLKDKFGSNIDEAKSKSFFDKIIQLPFNLPVSQYNISNYFKNLLKLECDKDEIDIFVHLANNSVGFNPRSMKRLFNSLELLKMVAKSKNILDADDVASSIEKQRILFGILCLQTSFEPLYKFILKNRSKIEQVFDAFGVDENLDNKHMLNIILKDLKINPEDEARCDRLRSFMDTLYSAIQLKSDDNDVNGEKLSDNEIGNFLKFLSFSSITTTHTTDLLAPIEDNSILFKSKIKEFLIGLNDKFSNELKDINADTFKFYTRNNYGSIYIDIDLPYLSLVFVISLDEFKNIEIKFDDKSNNIWLKRFAKDFFEKNFSTFGNIKYNGRAKYAFLAFEKQYLDDSLDKTAKIDIFQEYAVKTIDNFLPIFRQYNQNTATLLNKINIFKHSLTEKIKNNFNEEWIVQNTDWKVKGFIDISIRPKNEELPFIRIYSPNVFNNNTIICIKRTVYDQKYKDEQILIDNIQSQIVGYSDRECVFYHSFDKKNTEINLCDISKVHDIDDIILENVMNEWIKIVVEIFKKELINYQNNIL